jgi:hypothetical protein
MHTVITKRIDGFDIVTGFGERSIEPIETKKLVANEIKKTDEYKAVEGKQDQMKAALKLAAESGKKSKDAKNQAEKESHYAEKMVRLEQARGYENEIKAMLPSLKSKQKSLIVGLAVYFEPKAGEIVKTEAEISTLRDLLDGLNGIGYVTESGEVIEDNKGVVYCIAGATAWTIEKIKVLGVSVPSGAILYDDLDSTQKKAVDLQIEINEASNLGAAEKILAKESADATALREAESLRSRLEIQGASDALEQSQAFYQARQAELDLIFG